MAIINIIAFCLVAIGGLNWGLVGIFNWNLVSAIFGADRNIWTIIVYVLVFLATLWLIFATFYQKKKILFCPKETEKLEKTKFYFVQKKPKNLKKQNMTFQQITQQNDVITKQKKALSLR